MNLFMAPTTEALKLKTYLNERIILGGGFHPPN
jgi:hypothetical protein